MIIQNALGYAFFLISGLVLSSNWLLTTLSILLNLLAALLFYSEGMNIVDIGSIVQFMSISAVVIYSLR